MINIDEFYLHNKEEMSAEKLIISIIYCDNANHHWRDSAISKEKPFDLISLSERIDFVLVSYVIIYFTLN